MKQLVQSLKTGETTLIEVPIPQPGPGNVLVRTAASLVSAGTERMVVDFARKSLAGKARARPDLVRQVIDKARREGLLTAVEAAFNRLDQPMPLGYSSAGTVVEAGPGVDGFRRGDRVACAGGGWAVHAEYAVVPRNLLARLPDELPFEQAAFTTLGSIALHGFRLGQARIGEAVAVIGLGLLGQLAAGIAAAAGCRVFGVDVDPERVQRAEARGFHAVAREGAEEAAAAFTRGRGFDLVLICADTDSNDPVALAGEIARDRAHVVAVGAVGQELPRRSYFARELTFINSRSYGPGRYDPAYEEKGIDYPVGYVRWTEGRNLEAFVDLLAAGSLEVGSLISHRFPIASAPQAYDLITGKAGEPFLGVLLTYPESEDKTAESPGLRDAMQPAGENALDATCRVGVLGAGNFASAVMLPAIAKLPNVRLVSVASAGGLSAHNAARRFGIARAVADENEILADPEVNTVAVLTRHHDHPRQVIGALGAGKHVFCEKPLAIDAAGLADVEAAARARPELLLTVGFNRRFAPLVEALAAFLRDRSEPLHAAYRINAGPLPLVHWLHDPEIGGGRIIGEACHFIDLLTFLAGAPPVEVAAAALPDGGRYREDNVQMTFTFPDGSIGAVTYLANGDRALGKERLEVFSGGSAAVLDDFRTLTLIRDGRRRSARSRLRQNKGHKAIWERFSEAIVSGGPPPIPYNHLFGVTRASFAAVRALRTGAPVDILSFPGDGTS